MGASAVSANDPASPTYKPVCDAKGEVIAWEPHGGMTKREEFVKAAMQGILAGAHYPLSQQDVTWVLMAQAESA